MMYAMKKQEVLIKDHHVKDLQAQLKSERRRVEQIDGVIEKTLLPAKKDAERRINDLEARIDLETIKYYKLLDELEEIVVNNGLGEVEMVSV